jgi:hypothetical protein
MEFVKPAIVGANPLDIGAIWQRLWKLNRSVSTNAIGAVDVALWAEEDLYHYIKLRNKLDIPIRSCYLSTAKQARVSGASSQTPD